MEKKDFAKCMTYLGLIYGKEFTQIQCEVWYDFFGKFEYEIFKNAIKNIARAGTFMPSVAELNEECEKEELKARFKILDLMKCDDYFKFGAYGELPNKQQTINYDKAYNYLNKGIVPEWFKEDMEQYKNNTISNANETRRIRG